MNKDEIFAAWAPEGAPWSEWVRPVVFAGLQGFVVPAPLVPREAPWADASGRAAIVADVPGPDALALGLGLASRGFQPVVLFNGVPGPAASPLASQLVPRTLVATSDVGTLLAGGAAALRSLTFAGTAPPAFLLDSRRMASGVKPRPGDFDNRWITLPQDYPSATLLRSRGITDVVVVDDEGGVADDLRHVLLRWQEGGLTLHRVSPAEGRVSPLTVARPSRFRSVFYLLVALAGLRTANVGGFGGIVPVPSSGG